MVCCCPSISMVVGTLLIIWLISACKPLWRYLKTIKGHWLTFFANYFNLKRYRRKNAKSRQDLHEIFNTKQMAKIGMATLPEEVVHANPKLVNIFCI